MISAILLAAGQSKRFGKKNKLIIKYKNKSLIQSALLNLLKTNVNKIVLVLGYEQTQIKKRIYKKKNIKIVINKKFNSGIASSISCGLKYLDNKTTGFFVCLGDMPKVNKNVYNKLILNFYKHNKIIVPCYKNKRGNPVIFPVKYKKKLMSLKGDNGAKKLLKKNCQIVFFKNKSILFDIDLKTDIK